jgi:hypothetical protein
MIRRRFISDAGSGFGIADQSAIEYGWSGRVRSSREGAISTRRPTDG